MINKFLTVVLMFMATSSLAAGQSSANTLMNSVKKTNWFEQGNPKAAHQMYVIAEPNCSACHYLYEGLRPYIANGSLQVRWVLVAFMKKSSLGKAVSIISSKSPGMDLEINESKFNQYTEEGGGEIKSNLRQSDFLKIINNTRFMRYFKLTSTPIILFRLQNTRDNKILLGAPSYKKLPKIISLMGRLPRRIV